jgi:hypothetical protein
VIAEQADHLFDQVFLDADVEAPARRLDGDRSGPRVQAKPSRSITASHSACVTGMPMTLAARSTRSVTGAGAGNVDDVVVDRTAAGFTFAADGNDQRRDPLDVLHRRCGIDAALEAMPGVGGELVAARASGDCLGPPERRLDVDVLRRVRDRGALTTHDAGERLDAAVVGDDADLLVEGDGAAVEQLQRLPRLRPAHGEAAVDGVEVEDVRGPAELEHDVVRDVDQRRDGALAAAGQALGHPGRRLRRGVDAADDAAGEAPAQVGRLDLHPQHRRVADRNGIDARRFQRRVGDRRELARDAPDAEDVSEIGRRLEGEDGVVELQVPRRSAPTGAASSRISRPPWSSESLSSRAEHSMPRLSTPRIVPISMRNGSSPSLAPAAARRRPRRAAP